VKKSQIIKRPAAVEDLVAHAEYYVRQGAPETARRFLKAADRALTLLAKMPEMGHVWSAPYPQLAGVRVWPVKNFPHLIFYRPVSEGIEFLHVFHGAQDIAALLEAEETQH
jgi:plasmid stabilization system protein ParE